MAVVGEAEAFCRVALRGGNDRDVVGYRCPRWSADFQLPHRSGGYSQQVLTACRKLFPKIFPCTFAGIRCQGCLAAQAIENVVGKDGASRHGDSLGAGVQACADQGERSHHPNGNHHHGQGDFHQCEAGFFKKAFRRQSVSCFHRGLLQVSSQNGAGQFENRDGA